jgi:hypothetical protein
VRRLVALDFDWEGYLLEGSELMRNLFCSLVTGKLDTKANDQSKKYFWIVRSFIVDLP